MTEIICCGECIFGSDIGVNPRKKIGNVITARSDAGGDTRSAKIQLIEAIVDCRYVGGRNSYRSSRIVAARLLKIGEQKHFVAPERTAKIRAVLRLRQFVFGDKRKRISGIEFVVAEKSVEFAAKFVCSRLREDIDESGRRASEFGNAARCNDLKLADNFLWSWLSKFVPRLTSFNPPTVRELTAKML